MEDGYRVPGTGSRESEGIGINITIWTGWTWDFADNNGRAVSYIIVCISLRTFLVTTQPPMSAMFMDSLGWPAPVSPTKRRPRTGVMGDKGGTQK